MTFLEFIDKKLYLQLCLQNDLISQRYYVNINTSHLKYLVKI